MNVYSLFGIIILSAIISVFLKSKNADMGMLFIIACVVTVIIISSDIIISVTTNIKQFDEIEFEFFDICIKVLILSILSKMTILICDDAGEKSLSNLVQIISKFSVILIAFPLFEELLDLIRTVINL